MMMRRPTATPATMPPMTAPLGPLLSSASLSLSWSRLSVAVGSEEAMVMLGLLVGVPML